MLVSGMADPVGGRGRGLGLRSGEGYAAFGPVVKWYDQFMRPSAPLANGESSLASFAAHRERTSPMTGPSLHAEFVSLTPELSGYLAKPHGVPGIGVVVLMEGFGLDAYVRGVCERFARAGYMALAPDLFHGEVFDYADRERASARSQQVDDDVAMREVGASLDMLVAQGARDGRLAIIGFGMGGRLAFLANAVHGARLAASVSFYGGGIASPRDGRKALLDRAADLAAPQLLIYGAADTSIGSDEHARIAGALTDANKRYTLAVLPDAPHGFATVDRDTYHPQAADAAWRIAFALLVDTFMQGAAAAYS
jgi:carboxymethylenebutenolidase